MEMRTGRSWRSASSPIAAFLRKMDSIGIQYAEHFVDESVNTSTFIDNNQRLCTNVCIGSTSRINIHLNAKCNFPAVMSCKKKSHGSSRFVALIKPSPSRLLIASRNIGVSSSLALAVNVNGCCVCSISGSSSSYFIQWRTLNWCVK